MKTFKLLAATVLCFPFLQAAQAERVVELSIENQVVSGSDFFFDLFLTRHTTSDDDIYLADSDFVLFFNAQNFNNPTFEAVWNGADPAGFCTFVCSDTTLTTFEMVRSQYFSGSSPAILANNRLVINLQAPKSDDQQEFDQNVAKIDASPSTHRLGRFKISGISNPNGSAGLSWVLPGQPGISTAVFSYEPVEPWLSTATHLLAINPADFPLGTNSAPAGWQLLSAKIFPNPVKDALVAEFVRIGNEPVSLELLDESGRLVLRQRQVPAQGEGLFRLGLQGVAAGFYQVKIITGEQIFWDKLLKTN